MPSSWRTSSGKDLSFIAPRSAFPEVEALSKTRLMASEATCFPSNGSYPPPERPCCSKLSELLATAVSPRCSRGRRASWKWDESGSWAFMFKGPCFLFSCGAVGINALRSTIRRRFHSSTNTRRQLRHWGRRSSLRLGVLLLGQWGTFLTAIGFQHLWSCNVKRLTDRGRTSKIQSTVTTDVRLYTTSSSVVSRGEQQQLTTTHLWLQNNLHTRR